MELRGNIKNSFIKIMIAIFVFPFLITSCSKTKSTNSPIEFSEDTQGPGFFSGNKGGFYLFRTKTEKPKVEAKQLNSLDDTSLKETIYELDRQIQRLNKDKIELERLKRQINNKIAK